MSTFITPGIIKLLFILAMIGSSLFGLAILIGGLMDSSSTGVLFGLIFGPLVAFIGILYSRVLLEVIMVFFRIESNTRQGGGSSVGPTTTITTVTTQSATPASPTSGSTALRAVGILAMIAGGLGIITPWLPFVSRTTVAGGSDFANGWDTATGLSDLERFAAGPSLILVGSVAALVAGISGTSAWRKLSKSQALAVGWVTIGGGGVVMVSSIATTATLQQLWDDLNVSDVGTGVGLGLAIVAGVAALVVGIIGVVQAGKLGAS